jgi:hypothetical protein
MDSIVAGPIPHIVLSLWDLSIVLSDQSISFVAGFFWHLGSFSAAASATTISLGAESGRQELGVLYKTGKGVRLVSWGTLSRCFFFVCTHGQISLDWYLMKDSHPPLDYTNFLCKQNQKM